jgi:hypothetical protein
MKPEKAQKIEKGTGYALLVLGLILIIIPALMAFYIFLTGGQVPQTPHVFQATCPYFP